MTGHGTIRLPAEYVREHVRLGYAATEHGYESATVTAGVELASAATTRRGLYVGVTRGRDENLICVITESAMSPRHATCSKPSSPSTGPTSPPSPNAATSPPNTRQRPHARRRRALSRVVVRSRTGSPGCSPTPDTPSPKRAHRRIAPVERARRAAAITSAEADLAVVDRATAPHREMLAVDAKRADQARCEPRRREASPRR